MKNHLNYSMAQQRIEELILLRRAQVLYDKKWKKLVRRARLFRFLPFIECVFAAGSMAIGNVGPDSDFDLIVAARRGRIFTARFFSIVAFDMRGWRRKNLNHGSAAADTVCLNHFVTDTSFRLSPPHNSYWQLLYRNLIPVYGAPQAINAFWAANRDWMGERIEFQEDRRYAGQALSLLRRAVEQLLGGSIGDWFEARIRSPQLIRIEMKLRPWLGYRPRFLVSDAELELHLDTRRIEAFEKKAVHTEQV